ncbi:hypothetical protein A2X44_02360 [candidate division CPR3 bacterium GWF2_35_18]|uniref:DUF5655 domain-containing protein n=1 Tax=candidate division CPR3 bacterium GW2011_GWF2_35_18 TaxID=1618350 RepID=A0A0G0E3X1_UNCC3|nr:MAG: hypothetical protein UR67_C0002G0155 [candidate division CPR3 bacterium GW2011_GWF2_35_18]KKP86591.1 MAG: hypothetical protein UR87_C0015G0002 [candidate division CPR3 bacterium GW2011_GWE2_35_7]OGB62838.1 MAG: hypothetical protein A2X44_02360 [candidate division CPR3 bacterium GWF2_35_18]OGB65419.1 MAG: hypothetical protein A2250_00575 [candidate division CPR3 bacterium RIFOXYA2_FULL_35_13]OGB76842.1 MAG: hypothetical protein A2476_04180 [candidate division CPR3 bacterium RIFOXYC2_FULL
MKKLWKCPRCKREFAKENQTHSCRVYPLEEHFKNKDYAKSVFEYLKGKIEKEVGKLKIESLPCCIHLVSNYTFGAVWAMKDGIRIDFRVDHEIKTKKIYKMVRMSANRFLYYFDIKDKSEIDTEIMNGIREAYSLNLKN